MKSFTTASILLAAASSAVAQFYNQSAPFNLIVDSTNSTIQGTFLTPCHAGAAIESVCLTTTPSTYPYFYNYSDTPDFVSTDGYITWDLHGGNFVENEPLIFSYDFASNVALPQFFPDYSGVPVSFDADNKLYLSTYFDDSVVPINASQSIALYRWYSCNTYYSGYQYNTLAWALGKYPPQNPTCQAVNVTRVFV